MRTSSWSKAVTALAAVALTVAMGACGSSKKSSSSKSASTPAATSGPGVGKPPVTIGDKNFTEEFILGSLYQEALAAKGYRVTLKGNIGSSEITYKALQSAQIDMYPEYTGTLLTAIASVTAPPKSAKQAYSEAKAQAPAPPPHQFGGAVQPLLA